MTLETVEVCREASYRRIGRSWVDNIAVNPCKTRYSFDFRDNFVPLREADTLVVNLQMCPDLRRYYSVLTTYADKDPVLMIKFEETAELVHCA